MYVDEYELLPSTDIQTHVIFEDYMIYRNVFQITILDDLFQDIISSFSEFCSIRIINVSINDPILFNLHHNM